MRGGPTMTGKMNELQRFAYWNHIEEFVHFTNEQNLFSILQRGVLSRKDLEDNHIPFAFNDEIRLDGMQDAISMSVTSPNYRMFYKYRRVKSKADWIVLTFDSQKILRYKCAFYKANAGCNDSIKYKSDDRVDCCAFEEMFSDWDPYHCRESLGLGSNETTDPQAEVMVFDKIPVSCISRIIFRSSEQFNRYSSILNLYGIEGACIDFFFLPRHDYKQWKKCS